MAAVVDRFKEQATLLGRRRSLVGVVTRPLASHRVDAPAVIILNTGIVHRVGHSRMYVTLSRLLANAGRTVVRFDFSGIGDSVARAEPLPAVQACLEEVKDVLDSIQETHGISRFILVGLCSGADHAVLYGRNDPRIEGLVLLDPTLPPTPRYYLHYVMQRLTNVQNWLSVFKGRSGLLNLAATHFRYRMRPSATPETAELTLQNLPFSSYLRDCYRTAAERGVKILAVFTTVSTRHTYRQQMLDAFPESGSGGRLRLEYFADSDHLFSTAQHRARLFDIIADWLPAR